MLGMRCIRSDGTKVPAHAMVGRQALYLGLYVFMPAGLAWIAEAIAGRRDATLFGYPESFLIAAPIFLAVFMYDCAALLLSIEPRTCVDRLLDHRVVVHQVERSACGGLSLSLLARWALQLYVSVLCMLSLGDLSSTAAISTLVAIGGGSFILFHTDQSAKDIMYGVLLLVVLVVGTTTLYGMHLNGMSLGRISSAWRNGDNMPEFLLDTNAKLAVKTLCGEPRDDCGVAHGVLVRHFCVVRVTICHWVPLTASSVQWQMYSA